MIATKNPFSANSMRQGGRRRRVSIFQNFVGRRQKILLRLLALLALAVVCFYLNWLVVDYVVQHPQEPKVQSSVNDKTPENASKNKETPKKNSESPSSLQKKKESEQNAEIPIDWSKFVSIAGVSLPPAHQMAGKRPPGAVDIARAFEWTNAHYTVRNIERWGPPTATNVDAVIVVQVHNRGDYFRSLIQSLSRVRGIERSLVVFSHDFFSEQINIVVDEITAFRTIQLFYPYNMQIFSNIFPGSDPRDCSANVTLEHARRLQCQNWRHPDTYGHYRSASLVQIKHHWLWKMNNVFGTVIHRYGLDERYVVLLEEDHVVAPDLLHTLSLMAAQRETLCPHCALLCLGVYNSTKLQQRAFATEGQYERELAETVVEGWFSSRHNMGMTLKADLWARLTTPNCRRMFCEWDDYNWDWSLLHMSVGESSEKCLQEKLIVLTVKAARVLHVGDCGVHTHHCAGGQQATEAANALFARAQTHFFPERLQLASVARKMLKASKPNGGWADPRDRQLCTYLSTLGNWTDDSPTSLLDRVLDIRLP